MAKGKLEVLLVALTSTLLLVSGQAGKSGEFLRVSEFLPQDWTSASNDPSVVLFGKEVCYALLCLLNIGAINVLV